MRYLRIGAIPAALVCGAFGATTASAETIASGGHFPANSDAGLGLETIAVGDIDGSEGSKLAYEIKEALDGLRIDQEQWFEIVPVDASGADAVFQGSAEASTSITELDDKKVESCVEKDGDGNCKRNKITYYTCNRYTANFYPDVELLAADGSVLYSHRDEDSRSADYCADEESKPSLNAMKARLVEGFSNQLRHALAPRYFRSDYRLLERRKGLEKADRKAFKQGLRLTKTDAKAACDVFQGLEANNPQQVSVLFNVGLCHESKGDFTLAEEYYRRAWDAEPNKWMTDEALKRVAEHIRAEEQMARRDAILVERYAEVAATEAVGTEAVAAEDAGGSD